MEMEKYKLTVTLPGQDTENYADSKVFLQLDNIYPGDGFWVNTSFPCSLKMENKKPKLDLYENDGNWIFPNYKKIPFPSSTFMDISANVIGSSTYTLREYKLSVYGTGVTVKNVSAFDNNGVVSPYFDGLTSDQYITEGQDVEFSIVSPLTGGNQADIEFSFSVQETGDKFHVNAKFLTN